MLLTFALLFAGHTHAITARYEVPVQPTLRPYATFEIQQVQQTVEGDTITVTYPVPTLLTGAPTTVTMSGRKAEDNTLHMTGPEAEATCRIHAETVCRITYTGLKFDPVERDLILETTVAHPLERHARREVAQIFTTEPVGILYLPAY
jgi:hypothetical protein